MSSYLQERAGVTGQELGGSNGREHVNRNNINSRLPPRGSLNYAYPIRPGSQQQQPRGSAPPNATGFNDGLRPTPSLPQSSVNAGRNILPRPTPPRHVSSSHYSSSSEGESGDSIASRKSTESPQHIYIGFDPSSGPSSASRTASTSSGSTLGVIPNFPAPAAADPKRASNSRPPPPIRRGTSSYYSQQTLMVSPIPEESGSSRHASYASSAAIPSSWGSGPPEFHIPGQEEETELDFNVANADTKVGGGEDNTIVRQASLGRKSKPTLTEIKNSEKAKPRSSHSNNDSSDESVKAVAADVTAGVTTVIRGAIGSNSPAQKSSPILIQSPDAAPELQQSRSVSSLSGIAAHGRGSSAVSSRSTASGSPLAQPPAVATDYFTARPQATLTESDEKSIPLALMKELGMSNEDPDIGDRPANVGYPVVESANDPEKRHPLGMSGTRRKQPPRLNMDAVRDAEARGSLTSLPDLIARATKLAAKLEHGRPESKAWGRGSFFGGRSSRSNPRDTDSISDILGSFPRPVLATESRNDNRRSRGSRAPSQWPLPEDFGDGHGNDGSLRTMRQGRRMCGLPIWAFVILVILAIVVIAAAVIVPLQLVNLSKNQKESTSSASSALANCKSSLTCENGGENIATSDFCGCVCTNGFMGETCSEEEDNSCTTFNFGDQMKQHSTSGISNATIGSALPRLFTKASSAYSIVLDPSLILAQFSKANVSCTLQNALVNFLGKTSPDNDSTKRSAIAALVAAQPETRDIVIDTSSVLTATATATVSSGSATVTADSRQPAVDQDALDFGRVAVLYIVQTGSVDNADTAQQKLNTAFQAGTDFGNVDAGNGNIIDFDNRSIVSNGSTVGGASVNQTATRSTNSSTTSRESSTTASTSATATATPTAKGKS